MNFRGTLKGITPEDAKKMFNYDMPADAKGITFKVRNKRNTITPYYPEKYVNDNFTKNPQFISSKNIMTTLIKIAPQIKDILYPVWHAEAVKKGFYSGHHFFMSTNYKRINSGLENILFTIGNLDATTIVNRKSNSGYKTGVIILDSETLEVKHIPPRHYPDEISVPEKSENQMVFAYYKSQKNYSPSIRIL